MEFPKTATDKERATNWPKIAEIKDGNFGFDTPKPKTGKTRFCTRILLKNEKNQFCVVRSEKYGFIQLPGGGIEEGESITEALKREAREETGWLITDIQPIGYTLEHRNDIRNVHPYDQSLSYAFSASPVEFVGTEYMEDEIEVGFAPVWMTLDEIIAELKQSEGHIESYSGCFSNRRDLSIANHYATKPA